MMKALEDWKKKHPFVSNQVTGRNDMSVAYVNDILTGLILLVLRDDEKMMPIINVFFK